MNPRKYVELSRVGEAVQITGANLGTAQQSAIRAAILMVVSHDQLMHRNAEWFVRQPHREPTAWLDLNRRRSELARDPLLLLSRMEQSVEVAGGPSPLVHRAGRR